MAFRNWPASGIGKCPMLGWLIKLLPMWVRAVYLSTCAQTLFLLTLILTGFGSASGSFLLCLMLLPLLKKPIEG